MPSIVIAQGGGPTAVINQTLCGAILAARRHDPSVRILGARYGVRGLTAGNVVDLTTIPEAQLRRGAGGRGGRARRPWQSASDLGIEIQKALKSRFPKARARVDTLGYLPRGYIGVIDETDRKEAFAAGAFAAQSALAGSGSVVLHYDGDRIEPLIVPLERVAGKTRHMPDDFFAGSNTVSDEGRRYFRRLLPKRPDIFLPFV